MKLPNKNELMKIWNTSTLQEFSDLNFDNILFPSNIIDHETYIRPSRDKDAPHCDGFEVHKKHKGDSVTTIYFVRSEDIPKFPIEIVKKPRKIHYNRKVYNLVTEINPCKIEPEKILTWRQIIDYSGIPVHTNQLHYTLYKMDVLYGRTKGQYYYRTITESAFGKDKYKESVRLLLDNMSLISDPTVAKLFYACCHNRDITINELPDNTGSTDFNKLCNMFMRIGDKTKKLDNRSRKTEGTYETAETKNLTVSFIHNIPQYYHDKGKKCFDDIYPYNVINRYYYNLYTGFLKFKQDYNYNPVETAVAYSDFIKAWIKSVLWYQDNWSQIENRFQEVFERKWTECFKKKEERFKDHFRDFALQASEYSEGDIKLYLQLLKEKFDSHMKYRELVEEEQAEISFETLVSK